MMGETFTLFLGNRHEQVAWGTKGGKKKGGITALHSVVT